MNIFQCVLFATSVATVSHCIKNGCKRIVNQQKILMCISKFKISRKYTTFNILVSFHCCRPTGTQLDNNFNVKSLS